MLSADGDGNPTLPKPEQLREIVRTEFVDEQYQVTYTYKIDHVTVRYRDPVVLPDPSDPGLPEPPPPNPWVTVEQMAAVWQVPSLFDEDGTPNPKAELHHALYLNGFLPTELQFSGRFLRRFEETFCGQYLPPCTIETWVCLLELNDDVWAQPVIDRSGSKYKVLFDTHHGRVTVQEERYHLPPAGFVPKNDNRLDWNERELDLPEATRISLPDADAVHLNLRLQASVNAEIVEAYSVDVAVHLRGIDEPARLRAILRVDSASPCGFILVPDFPHLDDSLLTVEVEETKCATTGETIFRFEIEALQFAHLIHAVVVEGPVIALSEQVLQELLDPEYSAVLEELWGELSNMELALHQFCFRYSRNERGGWSETPIAGTGADAGVDALWDNQLLEPGKEYEIRYALSITGESEVLGRDEENCPSVSKTFTASSGDTSQMQVFRFRTESEPSQNVARYVGFSYPHRSAQHPFYPDHLVPLITLKDQGLIRRIYRKHYGREALHPQLVDFAGAPVEPAIADIVISSSPGDCVLEQLAENCLPQGEGYTRSQVNFWDTTLETGSAYALELQNSGTDPARRAYSTGFQTSRFRSFPAHVSHVRGCFENALQIPVLDGETATDTLNTLFGQIIAGNHPPFDDAVEAVYRRLLGINAGRLGDFFGQPGEDFVAYLTSGSHPDSFTVWGIVLELSEPLVGREGVHVDNAVAETADLARFGIQTTFWPGQSRLLLRDRAGTRLLILSSADGIQFESLRGDTRLNLVYSPAESLRPAVEGYVGRTWFHLTPSERATKVEEILLQVQSFVQNNPALNNRFNDASVPLIIPRASYIP